MLEELRIRGLGVIGDTTLPLGPGLTVLTGETGAGKTMVVTGLQLLFGGRADSARVRSGADQASVDGRLQVTRDSPVRTRVEDAGGALDDGTGLVLRRTVSAAGRSRAYVGGAPAPVAVLAELAEHLLAVHGQSDQVLLTRPSRQRAALDRFAGLDLDEFRRAFTQWRAADDELRERLARAAELRREADLLQHGLAEIEAADPQPGEDGELAALAARLAHADALRLAARTAHDALRGDPDSPMSDAPDVAALLGAAARALAPVAAADPDLDVLAARVSELSALALDLGAEFAGYGAQLDTDPARLEEVEARRSVLAGLERKYGDGTGIAAVLEWSRHAAQRLGDIDVSDEALARLRSRRDEAARETVRLAEALRARRAEAARQLGTRITDELAGLAMAAAELVVAVRPRPVAAGAPVLPVDGADCGIGPDGADDVELCLRPQPGAPALPLGRGASGGELSRVMLAVEVCLAGSDPVPTMVFDEVDAGVGGRAAIEVGRRLARLAADRQVVVVTHLAQVAAYADHHLVVDKPAVERTTGSAAGGRDVPDAVQPATSDVRPVDGAERVGELARMLGGTDSGAARQHAAELLRTGAAERAELRARPGTGPAGNGRMDRPAARKRRKAAPDRVAQG